MRRPSALLALVLVFAAGCSGPVNWLSGPSAFAVRGTDELEDQVFDGGVLLATQFSIHLASVDLTAECNNPSAGLTGTMDLVAIELFGMNTSHAFTTGSYPIAQLNDAGILTTVTLGAGAQGATVLGTGSSGTLTLKRLDSTGASGSFQATLLMGDGGSQPLSGAFHAPLCAVL